MKKIGLNQPIRINNSNIILEIHSPSNQALGDLTIQYSVTGTDWFTLEAISESVANSVIKKYSNLHKDLAIQVIPDDEQTDIDIYILD